MFISKHCLHAIGSARLRAPVHIASFSHISAPIVCSMVAAEYRSHVRKLPIPLLLSATVRTLKTKASVALEDLPQGTIPLESAPREDEAPAYPTVILQARTNMLKFENCILLTRVGGFYEMYFEHAEELGPLLNLKVARKKTNAGPVAMAGFPFFQLDRFLKILVKDLNRYVAIAEEFPNNASTKLKAGGLLHDRKVSRVVTPGTLIDENFMDPYANNYVLAVSMDRLKSQRFHASPITNLPNCAFEQVVQMAVGLAWLDLSTGQFFTQSTTLSALPSAISRIRPSEIILDQALQRSEEGRFLYFLRDDNYVITYFPSSTNSSVGDWSPMLESEISASTAAALTVNEVAAGSMLLYYIQARVQGSNAKLQPPLRYREMETMAIDKNSMRALEIRETIKDNAFKGSLTHAVRRTVSKSGARLLNEWLSSPSTSLNVINPRLDLVTRMLKDNPLRESVLSLLRRTHDSQRLVQKFSFGRGDPEDLVALANTIIATQELVTTLKAAETKAENSVDMVDLGCLKPIMGRIQLDGPCALARRIKDAIDEEEIVLQHHMDDSGTQAMIALAKEVVGEQGSAEDVAAMTKGHQKRRTVSLRESYTDASDTWIMKPEASTSLKRLHIELDKLMLEKSNLSDELQKRLGAPTLTLRWTPGLGHICHVKGRDTRVSSEMGSVSSSKSTRSFYHPEWTRLGQITDQVEIRIRAEEQQILLRIREEVILNLVKLRRNGAVWDELDIACSFALLAEEQGLVRPILNQSLIHKVVGGRHPTVQGGLQERGRTFVTNDCFVGDQESIWLITGPNMGGKSTFLRQNALITIMAQVGSYVPAEYAEIGIVDQIFSRIGSADNLYQDQSTFMVEMLETATILKNATSRSFVIMDEIGRGTTPDDGVAVAFACLHHLHQVNKCRTLFATHFHSLAQLSENLSRIGYYCTDVIEGDNGSFSYVHKLKKGVNKESHALKVAKLAGLPESAIAAARDVLRRI